MIKQDSEEINKAVENSIQIANFHNQQFSTVEKQYVPDEVRKSKLYIAEWMKARASKNIGLGIGNLNPVRVAVGLFFFFTSSKTRKRYK